jgi:uncharacterized protein YjiS (DUF1127 family)
MFGQLGTRFAEWRLYRDTVRQLNWLDSHILADAGIARCEIKAVARERVRQRSVL